MCQKKETWYLRVFWVLIVPMRNWNMYSLAASIMSWITGFDRTYEELKPARARLQCSDFTRFWSYLWGIETRRFSPTFSAPLRFDRTYEELKLSRVIRRGSCTGMFWSYLWGIETPAHTGPVMRYVGFWSYLWGIETSKAGRNQESSVDEFWSYLWGIETVNAPPKSPDRSEVLIVPMRNWNTSLPSWYIFGGRFWSYLWGIETAAQVSGVCDPAEFWSYLWGIETSENKSTHAPYASFDRTYEELKRRWAQRSSYGRSRFDRTYEELKHVEPRDLVVQAPRRFDRTYEELKHGRRGFGSGVPQSFDRTYEELKQKYDREAEAAMEVLIVPMRNWNLKFQRMRRPFGTWVLIVPMRNWNFSGPESVPRIASMFWSYLWGIETTVPGRYTVTSKCVLIVPMRNWNIRCLSANSAMLPAVLIVPMRNWNFAAPNVPYEGSDVLIVPMRNWNLECVVIVWHYPHRFDRTYEELKHRKF